MRLRGRLRLRGCGMQLVQRRCSRISGGLASSWHATARVRMFAVSEVLVLSGALAKAQARAWLPALPAFSAFPVPDNGSCKDVCRVQSPRPKRGPVRRRLSALSMFPAFPVLANGSCKDVCRVRSPRPKRGPGAAQARPRLSALSAFPAFPAFPVLASAG